MSVIFLSNGTYFDFDNPEDGQVDIGCVTESLSKLNRFTGHTNEFYSVGMHSLLVSFILGLRFGSYELSLKGLMHDCHESVIGDISTPLKTYVHGTKFKQLEARVQKVFIEQLALPPDTFSCPYVKRADRIALEVERKVLLPLSSNHVWSCDVDDLNSDEHELWPDFTMFLHKLLELSPSETSFEMGETYKRLRGEDRDQYSFAL